MATKVEIAKAVNARIKSQRLALESFVPSTMKVAVEAIKQDGEQTRKLASAYASLLPFSKVNKWQEGMVTKPGDLVYNPNETQVFMYNGSTEMVHNNPLFYPGSVGVYYWAIVPKLKNGIKVYPDIPGITVAVKQNEKWYDVSGETIYTWNGVDNANCVWPPVPGNEWTAVE